MDPSLVSTVRVDSHSLIVHGTVAAARDELVAGDGDGGGIAETCCVARGG